MCVCVIYTCTYRCLRDCVRVCVHARLSTSSSGFRCVVCVCVFAFGNSIHSVFMYVSYTRRPDLREFPSSVIRRLSAVTFATVFFVYTTSVSIIVFSISTIY